MPLLVIACGGTKIDVGTDKVPAIDLYRGRQFALARALRAAGWDVLILSAEHGLLAADRAVGAYNRCMTPARADELAGDDMQAHVMRVWAEGQDLILFYGGALYERVFGAIVERLGLAQVGRRCDVVNIVGAGCGDHYSVLKVVVSEHG